MAKSQVRSMSSGSASANPCVARPGSVFGTFANGLLPRAAVSDLMVLLIPAALEEAPPLCLLGPALDSWFLFVVCRISPVPRTAAGRPAFTSVTCVCVCVCVWGGGGGGGGGGFGGGGGGGGVGGWGGLGGGFFWGGFGVGVVLVLCFWGGGGGCLVGFGGGGFGGG